MFHEKIIDKIILLCKKDFCIFFFMETKRRTTKRKTGPKPMDAHMRKASFVLPESLWDWAADQPEGASELLRNLLKQEQQRRDTVSA